MWTFFSSLFLSLFNFCGDFQRKDTVAFDFINSSIESILLIWRRCDISSSVFRMLFILCSKEARHRPLYWSAEIEKSSGHLHEAWLALKNHVMMIFDDWRCGACLRHCSPIIASSFRPALKECMKNRVPERFLDKRRWPLMAFWIVNDFPGVVIQTKWTS